MQGWLISYNTVTAYHGATPAITRRISSYLKGSAFAEIHKARQIFLGGLQYTESIGKAHLGLPQAAYLIKC